MRPALITFLFPSLSLILLVEVTEATAQAEMVTPFPAAPASALINSTAHC